MAQSFYGGKQGFSFLIRKAFPSIGQMIEDFQKGPNYADVNFNEHVIIDTVNKNNPDNGKVFRRGYDYNDKETGGAIYVGQIVGPSGHAPTMEIHPYSKVIGDSTSEYSSYDSTEINAIDPENCYIYKDGEYQFLSDISSLQVKENVIIYIDNETNEEYAVYKHNGSSVLRSEASLTVDKNDLVPGDLNKNIKIAFLSIRDANGEETKLKVGLQIPYHVFKINATHGTGKVVTKDIENSDAFYSEYDFKLMPSDKVNLSVEKDQNGEFLTETRITYKEENGEITSETITERFEDIVWVKEVKIDNNHILNAHLSNGSQVALGPVREGIIVGGEVDGFNINATNADEAINGLNSSNADKEKCYTWTAPNGEKLFFAYDFQKNTWYYIGSQNRVHHYFGEEDKEDEVKEVLSVDGIWFVTESMEASS